MSTHAYIGIENSDGSVTYAYCHHDGYLAHLGKQLVDLSREQAREIIDQGDMSCIGEPYSLRGEDSPAKSAYSVHDYWHEARLCGAHFAYLINKRGTWKFATNNVSFTSLKLALKQL